MDVPTPIKRPAEYSGAIGGVVALGAALGFDLTGAQVAALTAVVGLLPALATFLRTHGGLFGLMHGLFKGEG